MRMLLYSAKRQIWETVSSNPRIYCYNGSCLVISLAINCRSKHNDRFIAFEYYVHTLESYCWMLTQISSL